eukprot:GEMP01032685.1.p1 GENE.GEMP01032685.1~~GEMP01032685.1.p1  ORF type:complete len:222 (+),score=49.29 GEMP01032685.1:80-745(+)
MVTVHGAVQLRINNGPPFGYVIGIDGDHVSVSWEEDNVAQIKDCKIDDVEDAFAGVWADHSRATILEGLVTGRMVFQPRAIPSSQPMSEDSIGSIAQNESRAVYHTTLTLDTTGGQEEARLSCAHSHVEKEDMCDGAHSVEEHCSGSESSSTLVGGEDSEEHGRWGYLADSGKLVWDDGSVWTRRPCVGWLTATPLPNCGSHSRYTDFKDSFEIRLLMMWR